MRVKKYLKDLDATNFKFPAETKLSQLALDDVTTLVFGCLLVATSDNVEATLSQNLTLLQHRVFDVNFPTRY